MKGHDRQGPHTILLSSGIPCAQTPAPDRPKQGAGACAPMRVSPRVCIKLTPRDGHHQGGRLTRPPLSFPKRNYTADGLSSPRRGATLPGSFSTGWEKTATRPLGEHGHGWASPWGVGTKGSRARYVQCKKRQGGKSVRAEGG